MSCGSYCCFSPYLAEDYQVQKSLSSLRDKLRPYLLEQQDTRTVASKRPEDAESDAYGKWLDAAACVNDRFPGLRDAYVDRSKLDKQVSSFSTHASPARLASYLLE